MEIRKAKLSDVKELTEVWHSFLTEHTRTVTKRNRKLKNLLEMKPSSKKLYAKFLSKHIRSKKGEAFLAEEKGKLAGYVLIYIKDEIPIFKIEKIGYISDLFVSKGFRNKKLGSRLLKQALTWFKTKKIKQVSVGMFPDNVKALKFYKNQGFFQYHADLRKLL